jgi:hypothetical protein
MVVAFPAYHEETAAFDGATRERLAAAVEDAFDAVRWQWHRPSRWYFSGSTGLSLWSYGEKVEVEVSPGEVWVKSTCSWPLQCFDWGRNRGNVTRFLDALEDALDGR